MTGRTPQLPHEAASPHSWFGWLWFGWRYLAMVALLHPMVTLAGTPIALPASESAELWRDALEVAGLEQASTTAELRIEAGAVTWKVIAIRGGEVVREVSVPAPHTDGDRREIAFLAQAISRALEPLETPTQGVFEPPPLPSWVADPVPEPVVEPEPVVVPLLVATPLPPVEASPEPIVTPEPVIAAPSEVITPVVVPAPDVAPKADPDLAPRIEGPPAALIASIGGRATTGPALAIALQSDTATFGSFVITAELGVQAARPLYAVENVRDRVYWQTQAQTGIALDVFPSLRFGALSGLAYRSYIQQFNLISGAFMPYTGALAEFSTGRVLRIGTRLQGTTDLMRTELVPDTGHSVFLSPIDLSVGLLIKIVPRTDPIEAQRTLPRR